MNKRTVDVFASRIYFYYSLCYELTGDLAEIRGWVSVLNCSSSHVTSIPCWLYASILAFLIVSDWTYNLPTVIFSHCTVLQHYTVMSWVRFVNILELSVPLCIRDMIFFSWYNGYGCRKHFLICYCGIIFTTTCTIKQRNWGQRPHILKLIQISRQFSICIHLFLRSKIVFFRYSSCYCWYLIHHGVRFIDSCCIFGNAYSRLISVYFIFVICARCELLNFLGSLILVVAQLDFSSYRLVHLLFLIFYCCNLLKECLKCLSLLVDPPLTWEAAWF